VHVFVGVFVCSRVLLFSSSSSHPPSSSSAPSFKIGSKAKPTYLEIHTYAYTHTHTLSLSLSYYTSQERKHHTNTNEHQNSTPDTAPKKYIPANRSTNVSGAAFENADKSLPPRRARFRRSSSFHSRRRLPLSGRSLRGRGRPRIEAPCRSLRLASESG
jgi:phage protein D